MNNDTIFALSSGYGKSGVAVIRISGDDLYGVFARLVEKTDFLPRHAYFTKLRDNAGDLIDQCLVIYFQGPNSFTGQDVIELHTHGAPATINAVFEFLKTLGMRMAQAGEFSRRAFYNNKMDLADVDGLAALLDAQTDMQRKYALQSMMGRDSEVYNTWREQMVEISAYSAAMLDYSPDDLPVNIGKTVQIQVRRLYDEISAALRGYKAARAIRGGVNVALVGETNVGKSSIFNYMVGANRAIVSDVAGTTRDVISVNLDVDGFMINLSDTAGLRETDDEIESIGIQRTKHEMDNADIIVYVFVSEQQAVQCCAENRNNVIVVVNKSDVLQTCGRQGIIYTSAKTGNGMEQLMNVLREKIHQITNGTESQVAVNARTKVLLENARDELVAAINVGDNYDIFAEHVRRAADDIGKVLGVITANEVLDMTFGQLCLGK